jgi:hypothetical protein
MKAWRTTGIGPETLAAFVALTSCCAAIFALNHTPIDDRYLNVLNGAIASLLTGFVAYRFALGTGDGMARTGWVIAGVALSLFAGTQLFGGSFEVVEEALHLEDEGDIALLLVLPVAILVAGRAERIGRNAMLIVATAVAAQVASTGIDLLDDPLARTEAFSVRETDNLVEVSEFIFLQLYLIGLAVSEPALAARRRGPKSKPSWFKRYGLTPKRFYSWHVEPVIWRLRHPGRTPEDYYASRIHRQISRGYFHPAIGQTARAVRARSELLDVLLAHGLKPFHTVVDYGCGSFRLGEPVIAYLEPGKYWGLDVVEDFMTMGLDLMDPDLVAAKRPNALLINTRNLAATRAAAPDFVVSWHVCSKVPPRRLADYFGKMISLMGSKTLVLVHFPETKRRRRQSRFSWSESRDVITDIIHGIDPDLDVRFAAITDRVARGVQQTMVLVRKKDQRAFIEPERRAS